MARALLEQNAPSKNASINVNTTQGDEMNYTLHDIRASMHIAVGLLRNQKWLNPTPLTPKEK